MPTIDMSDCPCCGSSSGGGGGCCPEPPSVVTATFTANGNCLFGGCVIELTETTPDAGETALGITQKWLQSAVGGVCNALYLDLVILYCWNGEYVLRFLSCTVLNAVITVDIPLTGTCDPFHWEGSVEGVVSDCCTTDVEVVIDPA